MTYSNVEFTVRYVDPTLTTNGSGLMPSEAMNALPTSASQFQDNTAYIIRRTSESSALKLPNGTNSSIKNILFIGMPNPSDTLYARGGENRMG